MALTSFGFLLLFLPIVVIGAHVLRDARSARSAQIWILAASLVFYAADRPVNVALLLGSIAFNWMVARAFSRDGMAPSARTGLFVLGLAVDIAVLCVFKYAFLVDAGLGRAAGRGVAATFGFPLGVSFFTLTQVMYLVDCYERLVPPSGLLDHATFVALFPNVTAGPLVRAKRVIGQLGDLAGATARDERLARGLTLMAMGLFKKVVLADSFARVANAGYANAATLSSAGTWLTSLAFTFEMYFDFSGYSDLAFGAARLLGISLVRNFNAPYRAVTISDFWQRWHISLSSFITTYLYTPLIRAMGRVTIHTSAVATVLAMAITGLWHGAAWTFILFYVAHGIALATYQYWKRLKRPLPRPLAAVVTFAFVNAAFILFRAPDVATALRLMRRLVPIGGGAGATVFTGSFANADGAVVALAMLAGAVVALVGPTSDEAAERFRPSRGAAAAVAVMTCVSFVFMSVGTASPFLYRAF
ncbi:MAG TPA: MBOAT family O-acyltransferase [Gemmatimonadaceae bacterium]|nr:MBOAT family O-acyltransferase [Gemmatimonadaceae bacterium]